MEQWLKNTFKSLSNGQVIVFKGEYGPVGYNPTNASNDFPGMSEPPTHAALSALPIAKQGWQQIFDSWKSTGVIS